MYSLSRLQVIKYSFCFHCSMKLCWFGWLVVFNVSSTTRSFRDGAPIYCPLPRTWSSVLTTSPLGIEPWAVQYTTAAPCQLHWNLVELNIKISLIARKCQARTQLFPCSLPARNACLIVNNINPPPKKKITKSQLEHYVVLWSLSKTC